MADRFEDARRRVEQLYGDLNRLVDRDPEQEVLEDVLQLLDAVLDMARALVPEDVVVGTARSLYTARATADRELRAAEVLLMVGQIRAAIPPAPPIMPTWTRTPDDENPMKMRF